MNFTFPEFPPILETLYQLVVGDDKDNDSNLENSEESNGLFHKSDNSHAESLSESDAELPNNSHWRPGGFGRHRFRTIRGRHGVRYTFKTFKKDRPRRVGFQLSQEEAASLNTLLYNRKFSNAL